MKVDPGRLRAIAGTVGEAADKANRAYASRSAALVPARGTSAGWSAAVAARPAWESLIRRLSAAVLMFGNDLMTAADRYAGSDQRAATQIRGVR